MYSVSFPAEPLAPGYDLTNAAAGVVKPIDGAKSKRKQTLLSLLDALQELSKDGDLDIPSTCFTLAVSLFGLTDVCHPSDNSQQPSFEDDRDVRKLTRCI